MTKSDLADLIRVAVDCADGIGENVAAARLDQALVELVGRGRSPRLLAAAWGIDVEEESE